jgi:hypothetical protein
MTDYNRLLFYWGHIEGTSVLSMPRTQWNDIAGYSREAIAFDVRSTPMANITEASSVIATIAHEVNTATVRVSIFRDDPPDAPLRVNVDDYKVWTDMSAHPKFPQIIQAASPDEERMKGFAKDHVFFVKQDPGPDHRIPTLPSTVRLLIEDM